jgi:hypothetical protein
MDEKALAAPEVDNWYRDRERRFFKVVAIENDGDAIEVQHYDGTVAELDRRAWLERQPQAAEAPEDWSGSVDVSQEDFREANDEASEPEEGNPLDHPDDFG